MTITAKVMRPVIYFEILRPIKSMLSCELLTTTSSALFLFQPYMRNAQSLNKEVLSTKMYTRTWQCFEIKRKYRSMNHNNFPQELCMHACLEQLFG